MLMLLVLRAEFEKRASLRHYIMAKLLVLVFPKVMTNGNRHRLDFKDPSKSRTCF